MTNHPSTDKVAAAAASQARAGAGDRRQPGHRCGDAAELLAEHRCLSEVLYYEARGEGARARRRSPKWCSTA